jgi:signal transduction histidine kinase
LFRKEQFCAVEYDAVVEMPQGRILGSTKGKNMHGKQGAARGERAGTNAGLGSRRRLDLDASITVPIKANVTKLRFDQRRSVLNPALPLNLLKLSHEPAIGPEYQSRSDDGPITPYESACRFVSKPSTQIDNSLASNGVAHDIKNLLQVILNGVCVAEVRIREGRAEEVPLILERIGEAVHRVNDGVRLMRREPNSHKLGAFSVDIERTFERLGDSLNWAVGTSIKLAIMVASDLPPMHCVESEFENVILNLVINARDAMPGGGRATIEVVRYSRQGADNGIVFRVHDTGFGMSVDVAAKAFKPYFSTKGSRGTGLGLAMVASFARSVGGSALIEYSSAGGTTVAMHLPIAQRN